MSASARTAVEEAGGKVDVVYFTPLTLRAHLKPHKFDILPRIARPPPRLQHKEYANVKWEDQL